jgi:hypothetical protein
MQKKIPLPRTIAVSWSPYDAQQDFGLLPHVENRDYSRFCYREPTRIVCRGRQYAHKGRGPTALLPQKTYQGARQARQTGLGMRNRQLTARHVSGWYVGSADIWVMDHSMGTTAPTS